MYGNIDMTNHSIINLKSQPVNPNDAVTKFYVDNDKLSVAGGTMTGDINMNTKSILNLAEPSTGQGAATKNYVYTKYNGANIFIGGSAGNSGVTGTGNVGIGIGNLSALTAGNDNTAVGYNALFNVTTGSSNTAVGINALNSVTSGSLSTAVGTFALGSNTSGMSNTAVGSSALAQNTTGSWKHCIRSTSTNA
jgi:hypothetical protein